MKDQEILKQIEVLKHQIAFLEDLLIQSESTERFLTPEEWFKEYLESVTKEGNYFKKDGEVVMKYTNNGWLLVDSSIWSVFCNKFKVEYGTISLRIKTVVEEHFNCIVGHPFNPNSEDWPHWKEWSNYQNDPIIAKQWFITYLKDVTKSGGNFYKNGKIVMFENRGRLLVNFYEIWSVFKSKFDIKYDDIQVLIQTVVEEYFKCRVGTPQNGQYELW